MSDKLRVAMLLGSARPGRMCDRVAAYVKQKLSLAGFDVEVIDPAVLKFPLLQTPLHFYEDPSQAPQNVVDTNEKLKAADAYVVISAEYNHSMPPALTNMLDHFPSTTFQYKPCAIVCYSGSPFGGMRAAMQLRNFLAELGMLTVPAISAVATVHETLSEDGQSADAYLAEAAAKTIEQLTWYAQATRTQRNVASAQKSQREPAPAPKAAAVSQGHQSGPCCQS